MAWEIPTPSEIADQASTDFEEGLRLDADGRERRVDARSERSVLRVFAVVIGLALYPVYLFFVWVLDQLFADRCSETWLAVHARIWRVERIAATAASGLATFIGAAGTVIPIGTVVALSGSRWATTAAATIAGGGSVAVAIGAITPGIGGNRDADAELALESPIVGLSAQVAVVGVGGISGGSDLEDVDVWRGRVIERIRQPPHGGADFDYSRWARDWGAARVTIHRNWFGAGTVGVVFAMVDGGGFRTPTPAEVVSLQVWLDARRPVTATVVAIAASLRVVDLEVAVSPWSTAVERAVRAAATTWFGSADMVIGGPLHLSRLRERLSRAAGEDWHELAAPSGDRIVLGATEIAVLGTLTVEEPAT
jgi:uncharacterized phage protein gp47/JayE